MPRYFVHVVPGLEQFAADDMQSHLGAVQVLQTLRKFDERTSVLLFRYAGRPEHLLTLRSAEDVFGVAAECEIRADRGGLLDIRGGLAGSRSLVEAVSAALNLHPGAGKRVSFRVVARAAGRHAFRRVDMQRAVERAMLERFPAWRLVEDRARLEIWAQLVGDRFLAGARLSDSVMRQRTYRAESLPAALKPSIAYAMCMFSDPHPDDVFLDPMCGSGTIVLERAHVERYTLLLAGDIDPRAVTVTRANVGRRYKPIEIRQWDAAALPLENASISAVVTNMPFGRQVGTPVGNRDLYPTLVREWSRVIRSGRFLVLLTSERALLRDVLHRHAELVEEQRMQVIVRGLPAVIVVLRKV